MNIQSFASLRVRLTVLVLLAILPPHASILWHKLQNPQAYNYTEIALLVTAAIALVGIGSEFLLLRWVRVLTQVSQKLAVGDQVCIDGLLDAPTEIRQLAQTFNQMATSLKQQLTELQLVEAELRKANERFRLAAAAVNAIIYEWDIENRKIERTQGLLDVLGYQLEEAKSSPDWWFEHVHPHDLERIRATVIAAITQGGDSFELEYRILNKNKQYIYVWDRGLIVRNTEGQAVQVFGSCLDISDRKRVEAEIKQLTETLEQRVQERTAQLEATNRELNAFSYSVSHDLRAPLRHIRGFVDALALQLERSGATEPKVNYYLEVVQDSCEKMGLLIDGLLTLSQVGRQQLANRSVDLRQLVDTAIALVTSETSDNENYAIEFVVGDLHTVRGDRTLLQQVFSNLIDNAVKFSCMSEAAAKQTRKLAKIEIAALPDGTIYIKDNGVGFPQEYAEQLFGVFQRLHSQREFKGTGIGLAIVQRIIHRHSGTIWAESAPNQGATFYFKLNQMPEG